jgi:hypothetical protein
VKAHARPVEKARELLIGLVATEILLFWREELFETVLIMLGYS